MNVDDYIAKQESPQKQIITKLRKIILKAFPKITEEMKMGVPWYEGKYYLVGLKDSVNLGVCITGMPKEQLSNFQGKGKLMRHLKFHSVKDINEKQVVKLLKLIT